MFAHSVCCNAAVDAGLQHFLAKFLDALVSNEAIYVVFRLLISTICSANVGNYNSI